MNNRQQKARLLLLCGMSDFKLEQKLAGIQGVSEVDEIFLVRRRVFQGDKIVVCSVPTCFSWSIVLSELYRAVCAFFLCIFRRPAVIVAFYFYYNGIIASILGRLFGVPVIHALIGTDFERVVHSPWALARLRSAAAVAVGGSISKDRLIEKDMVPGKIYFPTSSFVMPESPQDDLAERDYDLIFVGSLFDVKRVDRIIDAVAILKTSNENIRLLVVGEGPLRGELYDQVNRLDLCENIVFHGVARSSEVLGLMLRSRVFVMTSQSEGLPMSMLEALSCGLPVVVPDVGDIRCIVQDGINGLLVDVRNTKTLALALDSVLMDESRYSVLRDGAIATREELATMYSSEKLICVWGNILKEHMSC